ncbi:MAG: hypothetical protein F6K31_14240 [Symploca sp. SIO2G7]|nr:hypothetical protein [Symploca sp. SIO2G7]
MRYFRSWFKATAHLATANFDEFISIPNSPFPIPHSPFPIPHSPFPIPHSPFPITPCPILLILLLNPLLNVP